MYSFKLNKKINIDKKYLTINENEFYPDLLDDLQICEYIKTMINTINPSIKQDVFSKNGDIFKFSLQQKLHYSFLKSNLQFNAIVFSKNQIRKQCTYAHKACW